jgi:hypothetical protein
MDGAPDASKAQAHPRRPVLRPRRTSLERLVLQPTGYEFVVNLKTAARLGINLPLAFITRADEVIE